MESLPDDVLHRILQIGTKNGQLDHVDLCSLAMVDSRFDQLTQESCLWTNLISCDFPFYLKYFPASSKAVYREIHEKKRKFVLMRKLFEETESGRVVNSNTIHQLMILLREPSHGWYLLERRLSRWITKIIDTRPNVRTLLTVLGVLPAPFFPEEDPPPPVLSYANHYYEKKPRKRFDKLSKPKAIPMSKSYISMNRPPRRSMARKI